jgi:[acyl-carrier-protein] S-malonyltransferase
MQGTVYANALGAPYGSGSDIKALLAEQMRSRVRWHDCIEHMIESGVEQFVEIGPSNVLSKMLKRRVDKGTQVHSVRDAATLEKFLNTCEVQS